MSNGRLPNSHLKSKLPIATWLCWRGSSEREFSGPSWFSALVPGLKTPSILHREKPFWAWARILLARARQRMVGLHPWGWSLGMSLVAWGKSACCCCSGHSPGPSIANNTHCRDADRQRGWWWCREIWYTYGNQLCDPPPKRQLWNNTLGDGAVLHHHA